MVKNNFESATDSKLILSDNVETQPMLNNPLPARQDNSEKTWSGNLMIAASAAVIGSSFQFGYNTGVINAPAAVIKDFYNETHYTRYGTFMDSYTLTVLWGFTVSIFAVGGMIGSFLAGHLANRFGRKSAMLINNVLAIIAAVLMGCSKLSTSYEMLIVGRFIIGINCGLNTGLAPWYLTEIAPTKLRGLLGTLNQMGVVTSILLSQVLGLSTVLGNKEQWPILLSLTAAFSLYQLMVLPFCPESPRYLVKNKQYDKSKRALMWLRSSADVDDEVREIESDEMKANEEDSVRIVEIFRRTNLRRPMVIAIVLQMSQQLSGINAVFYYSTSIFESAGLKVSEAGYATVGMGGCNVVMTAISVALIEKAGRRVLHLVGLGGMFVCSIVLTISLEMSKKLGEDVHWPSVVSIVAVILYVAAFQTGPGSIPWFITAELFNEAARSSAISVAGLVNWTCNFLVGIGYPTIEKVIDGYTFLIFAILLAIFWIFTYIRLPETKGKTIHEITALFY